MRYRPSGRRAVGPPRLRDLDPDVHLDDPARKQRYVTTLFDTIAPSYDGFTRWFSLGMDAAWKRELVRWARELIPGDGVVVDVACGTGDLGAAVARRAAGSVQVLALDASRNMLARARLRLVPGARAGVGGGAPAAGLGLLCADLMALPFPDRSVDVALAGYGFRNVPDPPRAIAEVARVLRPRGWLLALDFFLPERDAWRRAFLCYLRAAGRLVGRVRHGEPEAYGYIARSLDRWVHAERFETWLTEAGFAVERRCRKLGGGIWLHAASRGE